MDSTSSMMIASGPSDVRVLLIDNDSNSLSSVEEMLKEFDYKVTSLDSLQQGFDLLNQRKDGFDIVMCENGELDSFSFVHHVAGQMGLPVAMMSGDKKDGPKAIKGFQHGACAHFYKPITMKEVHDIWHLVVQKTFQAKGNGAEESHLSNRPSNSWERTDVDNGTGDASTSSTKKPRVAWNPELHHKFVEVVNKIGLEKAGPKKILIAMGAQGLSRENIASHLQKYRLSLQQKKFDIKPNPADQNYPDMASRRHPVHLYHQNITGLGTVFTQPNVVPNETNGVTLPTLDQRESGASLYPDAFPVLKQDFLPNNVTVQGGQLDHMSFPSPATFEDSIPSGCIHPSASPNNAVLSFPSTSTLENSVPSNALSFPSFCDCTVENSVPCTQSSFHDNNLWSYDEGPGQMTNSIVEFGTLCNHQCCNLNNQFESNLQLSSGPHYRVNRGSINYTTEQYDDHFWDEYHQY